MKQRNPDGPRINYPRAIAAQMFPARFKSDPLAFGLTIARNYGDIAYYRFGPLRVYQLNHPDLVRQVLFEQPEKFHKPRLVRRAFRPIAGNGLLTSDGDLWKQQRKLIQPAFHHRQLATYADVMVRHTLRRIDSFAEGDVRDIASEMTKLTLDIVVSSLFGSELPQEARGIGDSMNAVRDAAAYRVNRPLHLPSWVPTRRHLREKRALAEVESVFRALISARRTSDDSRVDLLSMLLAAVDEDSGARMSDRQLRDEMMTLFLAGHETTATALTWTWYLLARHPEIDAKLHEELRQTLGGRAPEAADLPKLQYTERVIREAMRLFPPGPAFGREPIEDVTIGGYTVPAGGLVLINVYALHHDPRFFANPERFDPDRFGPGWEERISRYAYLPFGGGPRVCIGNGFAMMEARLILATMAQHFKLSLEGPDEITPVQLVTLRPSGPVRMRLQKRVPASH
ncbi:MAG TPA: cytochrome P450 [Candidatus Acidoferrum sp.]|nr:cytochrome P450 [Candidatus Acidoferrum sp.]